MEGSYSMTTGGKGKIPVGEAASLPGISLQLETQSSDQTV